MIHSHKQDSAGFILRVLAAAVEGVSADEFAEAELRRMQIERYGVCAVCGEPFLDNDDWEDRQVDPDTGDVMHAGCRRQKPELF